MRKLVALPVLSADALSSVAYGPEAMLAILVLGGSAGLSYSLPIAAHDRLPDARRRRVLSPDHPRLSARRRSYIVASDNLGRIPGWLPPPA